ncbi:hypothetical protein M7I_3566 [Glarea lozoyensis 74030]|uniref:Uncharacterized protein n=1 Tax=Glarea lozoyensis (strain ATCC 74030 / MF5533) TaxID=1104152 RepID=H0ELU5_GLAL7|nr:hypothetical protein M7I_3566 [Glarea lozoyensis 74030]
MHFSTLLSAAFTIAIAYAAVNEPCVGSGGAPGTLPSTHFPSLTN